MTNPDQIQADPQAARACVETFIGYLKAGNAEEAEKLTISIDMDGFTFDPAAFPQASDVEIGATRVEHGMTIVPCEFRGENGSDHYPAVCVHTPDGIRIDLMKSLQLAMGADPSELMKQVTDQLEVVAEGMASAMGAVASTMGRAFDEFANAMTKAPTLIADDQICDDYDEQIANLEATAIPSAAQQLESLTGHQIKIDVDWAGTGNAKEALLLASTGLGIIVSACAMLATNDDSKDRFPDCVQRIMLEWDDDVDWPEISVRNQTLSVSFGPFLIDNPPSPIVMAELLKEPLGLE